MKIINMAAEPTCAKDHARQPAMTEDVVPGENGTLQNVVVYLQGDFSQYAFTTPTAPVTIDQKGCQYQPHVLALMTNQPSVTGVRPDPKSSSSASGCPRAAERTESPRPGASP